MLLEKQPLYIYKKIYVNIQAVTVRDFLSDIPDVVGGQWRQPGMVISVVDGTSEFVESVGVCSAGGQQPVGPFTQFALASCTKPFAVTVALMLQDEGLIDLDSLVIRYLPGLQFSSVETTVTATVRDLMCNRLGLLPSEGRHRQAARNRDDLIARMRFQPFRHKLGETYGYCTDAFTILGAVLESVSGLSWAQLVTNRLLHPLGMANTTTSVEAALCSGNFAAPHICDGVSFQPVDWIYEGHVAAPAGGLNSCANDLIKWLRFLLTGKDGANAPLLAQEFLALAHVPHTPDSGAFADAELSQAMGLHAGDIQQEAYALGWYSHYYCDHHILYHTGSIDGFRSLIAVVPSLDFGLAVLCNADNPFLPRMLFQSALDYKLDREPVDWSSIFLSHQQASARGKTLERAPLETLSAEERDFLLRLEGRYEDNTGFGEAVICLQGDRFILQVGELTFELRATRPGHFDAIKVWPYRVGPQFQSKVQFNNSGQVVGFTTSQCAKFMKINR